MLSVLVGSGEILKTMDTVDSARAQVGSLQVSDGRLQPSQSRPFKTLFIFRLTMVKFGLVFETHSLQVNKC